MERLRTYRSLHMRCIGVALAFARCYSRFSMATKRSKIDKAVESVAKIIQAQLDTLPPSVANLRSLLTSTFMLRISPRVCLSSGGFFSFDLDTGIRSR